MTIVCIAGMHRSGTSMITRALNLSGLFLGTENDISINSADNPEGFWENIQFVRLNDEILARHQGAWDVPPVLQTGWELHADMLPYRAKAQHIIDQFKDHTTWGWKDPRNSLTIDFWKSMLPMQKVIVCVRNPLEVVQSLSKRGYSSPRFGLNLWLSYNKHLLEAIPPESRIITHFDSYFSSPDAELKRVLDFLGIPIAEEKFTYALTSISLPLRHNHVALMDIMAYEPPIELLKLYQEMCSEAGLVYQDTFGNNNEEDIAKLSSLIQKKDLDLRAIIQEQENELMRIKMAYSGSETELINVKNQLAATHVYIREQDDKLTKIKDALVDSEAELANAKNQLAATHVYIREQDDKLTKIKDALVDSEAELANAKNQLAAMYKYIQQKEQDIRIAVSFIEELHRSIGWRLVLRYRSMLDRFAPAHSFRRRIHDIPLSIYRRLKRTKSVLLEPVPATLNSGEHHVSPEIVPVNVNKQVAVCTIASKNYLSLVRVFAGSMARTNPNVPIYVLVVDQVENKFDPDEEPYHVITVEELGNIPNPKHLFFKYTPIELNTAVKPYFLEYLMDKFQLEKICFFDPDIYVFSKLDGIWDLLENHSLVVIPHITAPYPDDRHPSELEINLAGVFNLGFIGVSKTQTTAIFMEWWKDRLYDYCYMNPSQGMHVDQNWVNFAPAMHDGVFILRDPAYNIAYWNLHERGDRLRFENEKLYIDHRPVVFFHFSGFNPQAIEIISVHQDRFTLKDFPNIRPLYEFYRDLIKKANYSKIKQWPYAFGRFDNGVKIPHLARALYNRLGREQALKLGDPFSVAGKGTFFSWMSDPVDGLVTSKYRPAITRLQLEMHEARIDLQRAFPDPLGADRERFRDWLQNNAAKDFDLDSAFIITSDDVDRPVAARHLSILTFAVGRIARSLHRTLKESTKRILRPDSHLFQKLRFINKAFLEKTSFGETPKTMNKAPSPALNLPSSLPFGVNVAGYIQGEFGVAEVARASLKSLLAVEIPQVLINVHTHVYRHEDKSFDQISSGNPYRVNLVHVNADQVPEFARQKGDSYFQGRYNIGCWFWELSSFPSKWRSSFDYYQEIWVASGFCQESIASRSPIPVVKMTFPILIDKSHAQPNRKLFGLPEDKFLYGFVFDYLSLAERKNPFGLIKAFNMAFEEQDDAFLVIKTINSEHAPEKADLLRKAAKDRKVQFIDGYLSRQDTISLMSSFDSFVSLHRSEGLGIGMAQAMFLKKPVIATGYSGNMEFMNHNNSFLVRYKLTELEENYGPYEKGSVWAEPDLEHAAELMRLVFDNRTLSQQVAKRAELDVKTTMTPAVAGQEMRSRLLLVT